jgi:hypothetical protein
MMGARVCFACCSFRASSCLGPVSTTAGTCTSQALRRVTRCPAGMLQIKTCGRLAHYSMGNN